MKYFIILSLLTIMGQVTAQSYDNKLIPFPEKATFSNGKFILNKDFVFTVTGNPDVRLFDASNRFMQRLDGRVGLFFNQWIIPVSNLSSAQLTIQVNRPGKIKLGEDESYSLDITSDKVTLKAETDLGAMHGLETLLQLLSADNNNYYFPVCSIQDKPRFEWRGLMMDASRHFMPVDVIKRNIDGIAAVKMNVLHLHLTDDQGFRIESKVFPKLHEIGSDGLFYTQDQIRDIIHYANSRGIRVIPEFDIPGHATSWVVGYPELASAPGPYSIERGFGVFDPTIDPTRESTYEFLDKFLGEMAGLFNDEFMHIGGDENNGRQWTNSADIQSFMRANDIKDNHSLQAYFNRRLLTILDKYGKKMIGWDEIMQPELPKNAVIQSWRGKVGLTAAAKAGYKVLLSNGYYIDLMQPVKDHYLNDPLPAGIDLSNDQKKLVMGGEATMWSEVVTWETVDSRIWPRTAAIAERLWSSASVTNLDNLYQKLDIISLQLEELGLTHRKNMDVILRRLCKCENSQPLSGLIKVLEPVKFYERSGSTDVPYRTLSPYSRMVDAAQTDAPGARKFNSLVEQYLMKPDETTFTQLNDILNRWISNDKDIKLIIENNPVLKEISPIVLDLDNCSKVALDALKLIQKNKRANVDWLRSSDAFITEAKKHKAQMELAIVPGIQQLVDNVKR